MRIYISGPITGLPDLNRPAFALAAEQLRAAGFEPVNPHDIDPGKQDPTWRCHMRADVKILVDCDAVATLPRWQASRGACIEFDLARGLEMECRPVEFWLQQGAI
jgi:hypothetical protein